MQSFAPLKPDLSQRSVHKFGGASLSDGARIRRVGDLIVERAPDRPIVVVSAVEGVTAQLDQLARDAARGAGDFATLRVRHRSLLSQLELDSEQLNRHLAELSTVLAAIRSAGELSHAHRDHVLSFGERASARIVAAHLTQRGLRAVPIDAYDLGLITDSNHGRARVLPQSAAHIRSALARFDAVAVITGFVAADAEGRLTTLGRNGSDVSAALIGEAIAAREVVFWKEVDGVMSADPKLVPNARRIERLSYEEARELTLHGASVLHTEAVEVLERGKLAARVCCTRQPRDPGTVVSSASSEQAFVGIACRSKLTLARLPGHGVASRARIEQLAEAARADVVAWCDCDNQLQVLAPANERFESALVAEFHSVGLVRDVATVTLTDRREVDTVVAQRLESSGVPVLMRWSCGRLASRAIVVPEAQLARTAQIVHGVVCEALSA